jgi:hypothetical protein
VTLEFKLKIDGASSSFSAKYKKRTREEQFASRRKNWTYAVYASVEAAPVSNPKRPPKIKLN